MKLSEPKRIKLSRQSSGIHPLGQAILFWRRGCGELYRAGKGIAEEKIAHLSSINPIGMSIFEGYLYFIDCERLCLLRMNLNTLKPEKIVELKQLKDQIEDLNPALLAPGSKIKDVHVFGSKALIALEAGYSSGIYQIDIKEPRAEAFFYSSGVAPRGVTSDPHTKDIFVADGRQGYLFKFNPVGVDIGEPAKLSTDSPHGLSIHADRMLYVGVENAPEAIGFSIEEEL